MSLNFEKMGGILPAIIQDAKTGEVLMLGFMNREAYEKTMAEGKVSFYSRTRKRLWTKGEESGNYLNVVEVLEDCDQEGQRSCFGEPQGDRLGFLRQLQDLLRDRKEKLPEDSYTAKLFRSGVNKIAQKLGEEAVELVIESKDLDDSRFLNEAADLLFHLIILLVDRGYGMEDVTRVLEGRH